MNDYETEIMEMVKEQLEVGGFNHNSPVRIKSNANGFSIKIGSKAFANRLPYLCDCLSNIDRLESLGYDVSKAKADYTELER